MPKEETQLARKFPLGFGPARADLLGRLIRAAVDEDQIPFIMGLDQEEGTADLSLVDLEKKFVGITKLCDKARSELLDRMEQSLVNLAIGGVITERKWDVEKEKWIPYKQKDVPPHFEAARWILAQWRPDQWSANRNTDDIIMFDKVAGAQVSDVESRRIEQFAGKLLEKCTVRRTVEYQVQTESSPGDSPRPRFPQDVCVDVEPEPGVSVQDSVLDVQPEVAGGDAEDSVHHLADAEPGDS